MVRCSYSTVQYNAETKEETYSFQTQFIMISNPHASTSAIDIQSNFEMLWAYGRLNQMFIIYFIYKETSF